jgi:DNA-binding beta-propeller fold protein YncE
MMRRIPCIPRFGILFYAALALFASAQTPATNQQTGAPETNKSVQPHGASIDMSTSKLLLPPVPGSPRPLNSFPVTIALSPDGRYAVMMNDGYGISETSFRQSLSVLNLETNELTDFPDERLGHTAHQSYFLGLQFSSGGRRLYASVGSITDPTGEKPGDTGNGIAVYSFHSGEIAPENFLKIGLQPLAPGKIAAAANRKPPGGVQVPYPAGLAIITGPSNDWLLVADDLSDDVLMLDATTGGLVYRFDLSTQRVVPGSYPYAVVATRDAKRGYVSLWNASRVAELNLENGTVSRMIPLGLPAKSTAAGSHPTALLLSPDETRLYVALANSDEVDVVGTQSGEILARITMRLPGQTRLGAFPNALAQSADGTRLYVADAGINAIAVVAVSELPAAAATDAGKAAGKSREVGLLKPMGFIPTEWYPLAVAVQGDDLLIANGKGKGPGPNNKVLYPDARGDNGKYAYIFEILYGSIARVNRVEIEKDLPTLTQTAVASNLLESAAQPLPFPGGKSPIKHVIYIIKENRTYDQVLGDIRQGNGDPSLVMFGEDVTPNQHRLAREFGILDNFYASGEVSGDGHDWSTAGIASDYLEKTVQINYRGSAERTYDYEGEVANRVPLEDDMPDVAETGTGYIWTNVAQHRLSYRHYGEFVSTRWCNAPATSAPPREGAPPQHSAACARTEIKKGEALPSHLGQPHGSPSAWPWPVPMIASNTATKPELRGHFDPQYADWNLAFPDQLRVDEFLNEFGKFVRARKTGRGQQLPNYVLLRLPNDHTSAERPGRATPAAAVADNDLAVGRVAEAISNSPYWDDTAILIVEDDAQDGPDHVDAHRSTALVISKYSPSSVAKPYIDSHFYTTVAMVRTLEMLLGLPPMNVNDAYSPWIAQLFAGPGNHAPFHADFRNRDNGLIYQMNPSTGPAAAASDELDFSAADRADTSKLNQILWQNRMGNRPMPPPRHTVIPSPTASANSSEDERH